MQRLPSPLFSALATLSMFAAATSDARADSNVVFSSGAANYCQPALPAFDGLIRTRPLAIQNEGSSNAFVTCSMAGVRGIINDEIIDTADYQIYISNLNEEPVTVSCTAVAGIASNPAGQQFETKTNTIQPGDEKLFKWTNADFSGVAMPLLVSYSCKLPPGAAINDMYVRISDDGT